MKYERSQLVVENPPAFSRQMETELLDIPLSVLGLV